jgi:hypothetical protein
LGEATLAKLGGAKPEVSEDLEDLVDVTEEEI